MHRILGLLALAAAGFGLWLLLAAPDTTDAFARDVPTAPVAYSGWAIGLAMGLTLAWLARVDWSELPSRLAAWVRLQRRRFGLVILGGLFATILLLF